MNFNERLGDMIYNERKAKKITQKQLSELSSKYGCFIPRSSISEIEYGKHELTCKKFFVLCDCLNIEPEIILQEFVTPICLQYYGTKRRKISRNLNALQIEANESFETVLGKALRHLRKASNYKYAKTVEKEFGETEYIFKYVFEYSFLYPSEWAVLSYETAIRKIGIYGLFIFCLLFEVSLNDFYDLFRKCRHQQKHSD